MALTYLQIHQMSYEWENLHVEFELYPTYPSNVVDPGPIVHCNYRLIYEHLVLYNEHTYEFCLVYFLFSLTRKKINSHHGFVLCRTSTKACNCCLNVSLTVNLPLDVPLCTVFAQFVT